MKNDFVPPGLKWMIKHLAILCLMTGTLPSMAAENYAILVGVSNYPHLESRFQLQGPANDVALMRQVLREKGFVDDHIQVLAEGEARLPTRKNILATLTRLTEQVKPDDFVFLYFSGHGSQQPIASAAKRHHEPDGLDELFLPRDIGYWQDDVGAVKNAIVDDELNTVITALRDKGTFTWAVFDSCHSGTMTRGLKKADIRERRVSPNALGVPAQNRALSHEKSKAENDNSPSLSPLHKVSGPDKESAVSRGGYVAFYAAQTSETTPEMFLPAGNPDPYSYGLFTYTLAEVLAQHDDITYRQAGQLLLQRYAAQNYRRPTPLFEGTHLDAPIFGTQMRERIPQWPIQRKRFSSQIKIAAGQLHQLSKGSILAILPNALATDEAILGYAKITRVSPLESHLKTMAYNGKPALAITDIPGGAYARLVESKVSLVLRVALPPAAAEKTKPNALESQARQVLVELIKSKPDFGVNLVWVSADQNADLYLLLQAEQLWLLPPTGELIETGPDKTHSIQLNKTKEALHDNLVTSFQSIAKVLSLLRMSNHISRGRFAKQVKITANVGRADEYINLGADKIHALRDGDLLTLNLKNESESAIDVTVLYVDGEYGITAMYPAEEGDANRIEAGGSDWLELELYAEASATERLVVIAVEAQPNTMMRDFSFLAQPRLPRTRGNKTSLYDLFLDAGLSVKVPETTRGAKKSRRHSSQSLMKVFSWKIAPKASVRDKGIRG